MFIPKIIISSLATSRYDWEIVFGQETLEKGIENSIAACLEIAESNVPDSFALVEVIYRGMHMGTFSSKAIFESPVKAADQIVGQYGSLIQLWIQT